MAYSCCNPFSIPGHESSSRKRSLRTVQSWMCEKAPHISVDSKICDSCRKKLAKEIPIPEPSLTSPEESDSDNYIHTEGAVTALNTCLTELGETPYSQSKAHGRAYTQRKVEKITEALKRTGIACEAATDDGKEIIQQLKEKFQSTTSSIEQLQILTILPKSWSVRKIETEFHVSNYMARQSKKLVKEKGVLSLSDPKRGPSLSPR